jgi:hypothetical protein
MMRKTIKGKSSTKRLVASKAIAKALGANETEARIATGRGPISLGLTYITRV